LIEGCAEFSVFRCKNAKKEKKDVGSTDQFSSHWLEKLSGQIKPDKLMKIEQDKLAIPLDDIHR